MDALYMCLLSILCALFYSVGYAVEGEFIFFIYYNCSPKVPNLVLNLKNACIIRNAVYYANQLIRVFYYILIYQERFLLYFCCISK